MVLFNDSHLVESEFSHCRKFCWYSYIFVFSMHICVGIEKIMDSSSTKSPKTPLPAFIDLKELPNILCLNLFLPFVGSDLFVNLSMAVLVYLLPDGTSWLVGHDLLSCDAIG